MSDGGQRAAELAPEGVGLRIGARSLGARDDRLTQVDVPGDVAPAFDGSDADAGGERGAERAAGVVEDGRERAVEDVGVDLLPQRRAGPAVGHSERAGGESQLREDVEMMPEAERDRL